MSDNPVCPRCGKQSQWNNACNKVVYCQECLHTVANCMSEAVLHNFTDWLAHNDREFLGYFNVVALGLFQHATQFRLDNPDKSAAESWDAFCNCPLRSLDPASELLTLIDDGQWTEVNSYVLIEHLHKIHDASFFGQWAVPLHPERQVVTVRNDAGEVIHQGPCSVKISLNTPLNAEDLRKIIYGKEE